MSQAFRRGFDLDPRTAGPATRYLSLAMLACTIIFAVSERSMGFGTADLIYSVPAILAGQIWRLFTYLFVSRDAFSLLINVLVFFLFGRLFEERWGTKDFTRFVLVSAVGAGAIAIPLHFVLNTTGLFVDINVAGGAGPVIDALLMALAMSAPNANIMFGFVLPMRAKTMVYVFIGIQLVVALVNGAASLSLTLGGLAMGYLLVTGNWRPTRWFGAVKKTPPRRRGLYVVPPKKDHTLH